MQTGRVHQADVDLLAGLLADGDVLVLTGAGISTESGIPDYRGPTGALRRALPMTYQTFTREPSARRRYWGRSHLGWRLFRGAEPNDGHRAVAALQAAGRLRGLVTQNVDGLHQAGGAREVVELHGNLDRVVCLDCRAVSSRADLQERLDAANPGWDARVSRVNPDGDVTVDDEQLERFQPVDCLRCGGVLKPDVVFFGENVPPVTVTHCYDLVAASRAMLVLGSSLTVFSGLRFVRRAAALGQPVVIVNEGATRGDPLATRKIEAGLGPALRRLVSSLPEVA